MSIWNSILLLINHIKDKLIVNKMSNPAERVRNDIEKSAFQDNGGHYLNYNSPLCKKIFKNWKLDNPIPKDKQNVEYLESYDRNLRKHIKNTKNKDIFPVDKK